MEFRTDARRGLRCNRLLDRLFSNVLKNSPSNDAQKHRSQVVSVPYEQQSGAVGSDIGRCLKTKEQNLYAIPVAAVGEL